eukprot:g18395.t1
MSPRCRQHRREGVGAGPLVVAAMVVALNLSTASLLVAATALPRSRWVAAPQQAGRLHDGSTRSSPGCDQPAPAVQVAVDVRCGATSSGDSEPGGALKAPAASESEGGLSATVKKASNKLLGAVGGVLGVTSSGGGGGGKSKAKKSSKSSKRGSKTPGGGGFTEAFEAKHGESHPQFNEKSFSEATETAWARNRLCLVYIPAEKGGGSKAAKVDDAICKALADSEVAGFVDANFVMWVPGGKSSAQRAAAAAAAAKRLGARSLPFLGVVNSASATDKMTLERRLKRSTAAMHHCNPPPSASQMVSWMTRVLDLKRGLLEVELAEQQRLKDEDTIHMERVEGYSKSLKDDALREIREKEEEAQRARLEEEERLAQEALEAKARGDADRRERKALEMGEEPPEAAVKGGTASTLMLRLTDGSRVRRRFLRADPMGKVLDWADVQGVDLAAQRLSSTLPKASFSYPGDSGVSIEEAGLGNQALLFVEQKPINTAETETQTEAGAGAAGAAEKAEDSVEDEFVLRGDALAEGFLSLLYVHQLPSILLAYTLVRHGHVLATVDKHTPMRHELEDQQDAEQQLVDVQQRKKAVGQCVSAQDAEIAKAERFITELQKIKAHNKLKSTSLHQQQ